MNRRLFSKVELAVVAALAAIFIVVLPLLHAQGVVSGFTIGVWGKYLCYALLAISVDLLWGYTGLLSLGQALFFALGGYMLGMNLMIQSAAPSAGGNGLPFFMGFLGYTTLPWFWRPFVSLPFAITMVILVPALLSLAFGWLAFRSRIKGVYFSILTQALTFAGSLLFFSNDLIMGGNNGFTNFKVINGADLPGPAVQRMFFIATAVVLLLTYLGCRWLTGTRFGLIQRAVRDSENRVLFSGYPVARFKLFVFVLSGVIAGLGGALFVPQVQIINPSEMTPEKSLEAVVWVAVGGRGTLLGPIIGAIGVNALKSWATNVVPNAWPILLGGLFVAVVILMPDGVVGLPAQIRGWLARGRISEAEPPVAPPKEEKLDQKAAILEASA